MSKPKSEIATTCRFEVEVLEPRILFSADGLSPDAPADESLETIVVESLATDENHSDQDRDQEGDNTLFTTADDIQVEVATTADDPVDPDPETPDFSPSNSMPPSAPAPTR